MFTILAEFKNNGLAMPLPLPPTNCSNTFNFADFFQDTPWLNIPTERQAVFIEPLYPRGGLLGGSSAGAPKMSKLQALAAARKKKAEEQKSFSFGNEVSKPMAEMTLAEETQKDATKEKSPEPQQARTYSARKRKNSSPHKPTDSDSAAPIQPAVESVPLPSGPPIEQGKPSAFANAMFGGRDTAPQSSPPALFSLPYVRDVSIEPTNAFSGPSPDDVVIAAQSKGSTISAKARN